MRLQRAVEHSRIARRAGISQELPLGFAEMPGDFLNAYVLKSLGRQAPRSVPALPSSTTYSAVSMTFGRVAHVLLL